MITAGSGLAFKYVSHISHKRLHLNELIAVLWVSTMAFLRLAAAVILVLTTWTDEALGQTCAPVDCLWSSWSSWSSCDASCGETGSQTRDRYHYRSAQCGGYTCAGSRTDVRTCYGSCGSSGCSSTELDCGNGRCVSLSYKCNGENDCLNNADEKYCTTRIDGSKDTNINTNHIHVAVGVSVGGTLSIGLGICICRKCCC